MKINILIGLVLLACLAVTLLYASKNCSWRCDICVKKDNKFFSIKDQQNGKKALEELEELLASGKLPPEISDQELEKCVDDIYIAKLPSEDTKENLSSFPAENTRYWPYYYYTFPYNYKYGGAWPPGMYSRLYYWSPGYYTGSGWSYYMRPGVGYKKWPRDRWIRNTQDGKHTYYYLSNRGDYIFNAANYADLPLYFHS